jgi:hypothetical protein
MVVVVPGPMFSFSDSICSLFSARTSNSLGFVPLFDTLKLTLPEGNFAGLTSHESSVIVTVTSSPEALASSFLFCGLSVHAASDSASRVAVGRAMRAEWRFMVVLEG